MASSSSISPLCSPTTTLSLYTFPRTRRIPKRNPAKTYAIRRTDHRGDRDHDQDRDSKNQIFFNRSLVDEDMIVLRKRIHEAKMSEEGYYEPPVEWMDWERRLYADNYYSSLICDALLQLQSCLMETRPSFVLGVVVFVALCVPASVAVVFYSLLVRGIF